MSYSYTVEVYNTKVNVIKEHRNSHGSGPAVWGYIHEKVFNKPFPSLEDPDWKGMSGSDKIDHHDLVCLGSTYDRGFIGIENLNSFAESARIVHNRIIENTSWTWNHFKGFAEDAEALAKSHDYRCLGMAINCTSVCDTWFSRDTLRRKWEIYHEIGAAS